MRAGELIRHQHGVAGTTAPFQKSTTELALVVRVEL